LRWIIAQSMHWTLDYVDSLSTEELLYGQAALSGWHKALSELLHEEITRAE